MQQPLENLIVWQKAMQLAKEVYSVTRSFPQEERYGLTSQIRRSCISVPSNIAEGSQRSSDKEFAHFLQIARGSWAELKTQLLLAHDFEYISSQQLSSLMAYIDETGKMMNAFHTKLTANR